MLTSCLVVYVLVIVGNAIVVKTQKCIGDDRCSGLAPCKYAADGRHRRSVMRRRVASAAHFVIPN